MDDRLLTIPNILTLTRLPLSVLLFASIALEYWLCGLIVFALASLTDWLDGFLARLLKQQSAIGRNLDPLIDKVMTCGAFIYLMQVPAAELMPWMVTVVIGRELLITGLRGMMEAHGVKFGADQLGKLKMALQCVVLIVVLAVLWLRSFDLSSETLRGLRFVQLASIYLMLLATVASGIQYIVKAVRLWRNRPLAANPDR
jgi:CDP-diacylglycerol--glycerol-3-phosphate 3-phosphatidyltransferase